MTEQEKMEKVIKGMECCTKKLCIYIDAEKECPYIEMCDEDFEDCTTALAKDALALLKTKKEKKAKKPDMKCNMCKHYQGVHGVAGHAPCAFWEIGGVLWNDIACKHFEKYVDEAVKWE